MYKKNKYTFSSRVILPATVGLFFSTGILAQSAATGNQSGNQKNATSVENTTGTTVTVGGNPIHTVGKLPAVGTQVKDFTLTSVDLKEKTLSDFKGKYIVMNIFPSVNTGTCSRSVRKFNEEAANLKNTTVLCISKDLPFAQKQFCGAEGINNVVMLSDFRSDFGSTYGVQIKDGAMRGLLSRAVVVVDPGGKIVYEEQVPELSHEPNYEAAKAAIR
jgi:thiol peroxidase